MADVAAFETAGRIAWRAGSKRVAPPSILEAFADLPVGSGYAEAATAWYRGWDAENLAAPIPPTCGRTAVHPAHRYREDWSDGVLLSWDWCGGVE